MDIRKLEYFVCVAEAGSFSAAAAVLNIAQPSLSRQIALLEHDLGQRLLTRTGRGVVPTEAGEALLVHAHAMLDAARRARDELRELHASPSGRVVVGMTPRVALGLGVRLVERFRTRFPRAVITVLEGLSRSMHEALVAGRLDMALLFDPPSSPQLTCEVLMREQMLFVAPADTVLPDELSLQELGNYPMVLPSKPNAIRSVVESALQPYYVDLQIVAEVGAVPTALALVSKGIGCTILPESALASVRRDGLAHAFIGPPRILNTFVLAIPNARPATRLIRETTQMLRELDFRGPAFDRPGFPRE